VRGERSEKRLNVGLTVANEPAYANKGNAGPDNAIFLQSRSGAASDALNLSIG
jgi:hypothetical protein